MLSLFHREVRASSDDFFPSPRIAIVAGRGLGYTAESYNSLCDILQRQYEVHVLQDWWAPDISQSARQVSRYVNSIIVPRMQKGALDGYYLMGHSYGGRSIMEAVRQLDVKPEAVVAWSPAISGIPKEVLIGRALAHHNMKALGFSGYDGFRHALGITLGYSARFVSTLGTQLDRLDDLEKQVHNRRVVRIPGLIILPEQDKIFREYPERQRHLQAWYPDSLVVLLENAGHDSLISHAAAAASVTEAYLSGVLKSGADVEAAWLRKRVRKECKVLEAA